MKKEITILTTWDWNTVYEIDCSLKEYLAMQIEVKNKWEDWFLSEKYNEKIKFWKIGSEKWKTQYLSIEAPKNEPTQAEKDKSAVILRELAKKAEVNKLARFIEKRNTILERLRLEEVRLWEMTTVDKIECYNKYKLTK